MECGDLYSLTGLLNYPFSEFGHGCIGEGQEQDVLRSSLAGEDKILDKSDYGCRLPGTCACDDQSRSGVESDGPELLLIEITSLDRIDALIDLDNELTDQILIVLVYNILIVVVVPEELINIIFECLLVQTIGSEIDARTVAQTLFEIFERGQEIVGSTRFDDT